MDTKEALKQIRTFIRIWDSKTKWKTLTYEELSKMNDLSVYLPYTTTAIKETYRRITNIYYYEWEERNGMHSKFTFKELLGEVNPKDELK